MVYAIYHNKKAHEIKLETCKDSGWQATYLANSGLEVCRYNDCYYFAKSRKVAREKIKEMLLDWQEDMLQIQTKINEIALKYQIKFED